MRSRTLQLLAVLVFLSGGIALAENTWSSLYDFRTETTSNGVTFQHVVYEPDGVQAEQQYPLVLYLHGCDGSISTHERVTDEAGLAVWHWWDSNQQVEPTFLLAPVSGCTSWNIAERRDAVFELMDGVIDEFPIDPQRIYITGFSMGGIGTWDYIQQRSGFFAAAGPMGIGGGIVNPQLVKDTPIWTTIGDADTPSRITTLSNNVSNIRAANGDPRGPETWVTGVNPKFQIFPFIGHGGTQDATVLQGGYREWFYDKVNDGDPAPNVYFSSLDEYGGEVLAEGGDLPVSVCASSDTTQVDYYLGDDLVGTRTGGSFDFTYTGLAQGTYDLYAIASDAGGKTATATQRVELLREAGLPGDANRDGAVSDADYTLWADHYGQAGATWEMGDFDGSGIVTDADYTIWADHYGQSSSQALVPEPAALSLLLTVAAMRRTRKGQITLSGV
jgi:predicted esterase